MEPNEFLEYFAGLTINTAQLICKEKGIKLDKAAAAAYMNGRRARPVEAWKAARAAVGETVDTFHCNAGGRVGRDSLSLSAISWAHEIVDNQINGGN